jgi:hypothetical protein
MVDMLSILHCSLVLREVAGGHGQHEALRAAQQELQTGSSILLGSLRARGAVNVADPASRSLLQGAHWRVEAAPLRVHLEVAAATTATRRRLMSSNFTEDGRK